MDSEVKNQETCNHQCDGCDVENCSGRGGGIQKLECAPGTSIKKTIAVISGKGGVGKSLVSSLLAVELRRRGLEVGLLDADVTGPSIPRSFGLDDEQASGENNLIFPLETKNGIKMMSANLLLEDSSAPIIWRGPLIASLVGQMYSQVLYGKLDVLLIDMPPGTGDVPLTVFQQIPVDGVIVVTSPQNLVGEIVEKSVRMAQMMNINLLGLVENMSYYVCPHCGEKLELYGHSKAESAAARHQIPMLDSLPIDSHISSLVDEGKIEEHEGELLPLAIKSIIA